MLGVHANMNNSELLELAITSLRHRKLRSWLAILGIVIGVASVISLISISVGLNESIEKNLSGLGADIITISSGAARADRAFAGAQGGGPPNMGTMGGASSGTSQITFLEADSLRSVEGVEKLDARVQKSARVSYRNMNTSVTVIGTEPSAFPASSGVTMLKGRTFGESDPSSVVLGYSVESETFNESMLNKQIKINGVPFRVIGVLNQSGSTFSGPDRNVFITQRAAKKLFNQTDTVSSVVIVASSDSDPDDVAEAVAQNLRLLHRVTSDNQDFTVTTASSTQAAISSVSSTLGLFLGAIASISLIVGGIGVANAMFTSVLEQTKYIGLLKSLGSRNGAVLRLFLFESGLLGLVGGLLGILLSFFGSALLSNFGLPTKITLELVLLGLAFSVGVGVISGVMPARNAASVAPVEALRYE